MTTTTATLWVLLNHRIRIPQQFTQTVCVESFSNKVSLNSIWRSPSLSCPVQQDSGEPPSINIITTKLLLLLGLVLGPQLAKRAGECRECSAVVIQGYVACLSAEYGIILWVWCL